MMATAELKKRDSFGGGARSEVVRLIEALERLNATLESVDSTLGLFYEEKYGGKIRG